MVPGSAPPASDVEPIEVELLLEAINRRYSLDFRSYARGSLKRRLARRMQEEGLETLSALQERMLRDPACMERLLLDLSINVTAMSLAILLEEEGIYERRRIYATDVNELVLGRARGGVFALEKMRQYTDNYIKAGGTRAFSDYYVAGYDGARFQQSLMRNVVFARHNLVSDGSFNEFNVVICRNVMIYFDKALQAHVHRLFYDSLPTFGVLALGRGESIRFTPCEQRYEEIDGSEKLYRKVP